MGSREVKLRTQRLERIRLHNAKVVVDEVCDGEFDSVDDNDEDDQPGDGEMGDLSSKICQHMSIIQIHSIRNFWFRQMRNKPVACYQIVRSLSQADRIKLSIH